MFILESDKCTRSIVLFFSFAITIIYLTTKGWKKGKSHRIEIWFVVRKFLFRLNQIDFSDQIHKPSIFWWSALTKDFLYTEFRAIK